MKTIIILLSLLLSMSVSAQTKKKLYFYDFPAMTGTTATFEVTYTTDNLTSVDTLIKQLIILLPKDYLFRVQPEKLVKELNKKLYCLEVNNLTFKN